MYNKKNIDMLRMQRKLSYIFLLSSLLLLACNSKKVDKEREPIAVKVYTIADAGYASGHEYVGTIVERSGTSLSFEVPGNVVKLFADNGDHVRKGQLLATIDPTSLRDAHKMSLSMLKQAKDAYQRFEPLHRQGVISDIRWVEIQTKLEQAQSAEQLARTQLAHTSLTAPFAGVIAERNADQGMNVVAGQPIYRLVDIAGVDVKIAIPENEVAKIKIGASASVVVDAVGGKQYSARVKEKGIAANAISHTYDVKLSVSNADGSLIPGMVCDVKLNGKATCVSGDVAMGSGDSPLSIPTNAVKLDSDNRRFVWLAVNGKAKRQFVSIGDFTEKGISVTSGLHIGDKVITDGSQKVSEGMKVKY